MYMYTYSWTERRRCSILHSAVSAHLHLIKCQSTYTYLYITYWSFIKLFSTQVRTPGSLHTLSSHPIPYPPSCSGQMSLDTHSRHITPTCGKRMNFTSPAPLTLTTYKNKKRFILLFEYCNCGFGSFQHKICVLLSMLREGRVPVKKIMDVTKGWDASFLCTNYKGHLKIFCFVHVSRVKCLIKRVLPS